jgi:hypothetical protein
MRYLLQLPVWLLWPEVFVSIGNLLIVAQFSGEVLRTPPVAL